MDGGGAVTTPNTTANMAVYAKKLMNSPERRRTTGSTSRNVVDGARGTTNKFRTNAVGTPLHRKK